MHLQRLKAFAVHMVITAVIAAVSYVLFTALMNMFLFPNEWRDDFAIFMTFIVAGAYALVMSIAIFAGLVK